MENLAQQTFNGGEVVVDDKQFTNCVFNGVVLVYEGGPLPRFVDCQFKQVSLEFNEAAANTLSFLSGLRKGGFAPAVDKIVRNIRDQAY